MKFFIDTAHLEEIREINRLGLLDGVTTNPSLIAQAIKSHYSGNSLEDFTSCLHDHYKRICAEVDDCVSAEVIATDTDTMIAEGKILAGLDSKIVVKVPMTEAGLPALKALAAEGIRTNCTLVFNAQQALLAAKVKATFVSPFLGRVGDIGGDSRQMIVDIRTIYDQYEYETQILAASIRLSEQLLDAARAGADVATLPYAILKGLCKHPMTDIGLARFLKDYQKAKETTVATH